MLEGAAASIVEHCSGRRCREGRADRYVYAAPRPRSGRWTRSVACDFVGQRIRCNCICPARSKRRDAAAPAAAGPGGREMFTFTAARWTARHGGPRSPRLRSIRQRRRARSRQGAHVIDGGWTLRATLIREPRVSAASRGWATGSWFETRARARSSP